MVPLFLGPILAVALPPLGLIFAPHKFVKLVVMPLSFPLVVFPSMVLVSLPASVLLLSLLLVALGLTSSGQRGDRIDNTQRCYENSWYLFTVRSMFYTTYRHMLIFKTILCVWYFDSQGGTHKELSVDPGVDVSPLCFNIFRELVSMSVCYFNITIGVYESTVPCNRNVASHSGGCPYFSLGSFDFICPPAFSHLPRSVSPVSLLSFILSESTSSSLSLFFRSWMLRSHRESSMSVFSKRKRTDKIWRWVTLIFMSLSDNFFCFSASFRLRLSSSRRFLFSSSLCLFFSSSLLLLSSLFSSLILYTIKQ